MNGDITVTPWSTRHVDPAANGNGGNHTCLWDIARERLAWEGYSKPSDQQIWARVNQIVLFHNGQSTRPGFRRINNPDLIHGGQTVFMPPNGTTLPPGSKLQMGQQWASPDGKTVLKVEPGTNAKNEQVTKLSVYRDDGRGLVKLAGYEVGKGATRIEVNADGTIAGIDDKGQRVGTLGGGGKDARLVVQNDGNVVVYGGDNRVLWPSNTQRRL
jgi:hypothetical protein